MKRTDLFMRWAAVAMAAVVYIILGPAFQWWHRWEPLPLDGGIVMALMMIYGRLVSSRLLASNRSD